MSEINLDIVGLGIILYSPPAVSHIPEGANYLQEHFWAPADVARHVMDGKLTTFGTGSSGSYSLRFLEGPPNDADVHAAKFKLRLGLVVQNETMHVRDLYDLMDWSPECPVSQQLSVANGWYRLTVLSSPPASGIIGDGQVVDIHIEPVHEKPMLRWEGVPSLSE